MTISCDICKKEFKYNYLLVRHRQRKNPCIGLENKKPRIPTYTHVKPRIPTQCENVNNLAVENNNTPDYDPKSEDPKYRLCEYCNIYCSKKMFKRHLREYCIYIPENKKKLLIEKYNNHKLSKNKQLVINNNNNITNNNNTTNNTINNNNNGTINNVTININPLGQEDISFLTEEDKLNILAKRFMGVPELIKLIHNNPNNKNYYMPNVNKRIIAYLNKDNELEYDDYDIIIRKLIDDNKDRFDEFFYELRDKINSKIIDKVSDVVLEHDNNENINDKYSKDIKYNIMSKSREIKETIDNYLKELKELVRVNIEER